MAERPGIAAFQGGVSRLVCDFNREEHAPAVIPVASWEGERFGLNVALVPPLQNRLYGALSFQLKFRTR